MTREAALEFLIPNLGRERIPELTSARITLYSRDNLYALSLQKTCLKWSLDYSWSSHFELIKDDDELLNSDVIVIDGDAPHSIAFELCRSFAEEDARIPILIVTSNPEMISVSAWPNGVDGAILKSLGPEKVVEYIIASSNNLLNRYF